ncbi:MAG TPA: hypothetical protein VK149_12220 [Sideroxyarcus sp.]|nr:hypothetical protein [Sideroxyarcus sp.]
MNIIKTWLANRNEARATQKLKDAVALCESHGFTVCEIATMAGTDYIRAEDGSWRIIGGQRKRDKTKTKLPNKERV